MNSSKFLVLIPQAHSESAHTNDDLPAISSPSFATSSSAASAISDSSAADEPLSSFLVLAPHHRRASVSSVSSVGSAESVALDGSLKRAQKRVRFLGLVPETRAEEPAAAGATPAQHRRAEPEIVPDEDYVSGMRAFRNGFLRLG
ncbi:hypothetical protein KEM52_001156 [Ascosphaera acerosa]|nr:hypothetical protein KEM52_001156 [Ascosphaera acerosa]